MQCLEGQAVQSWYYLKRLLVAEGADADSWQIFGDATVKHYAECEPTLAVRTCLRALEQGGGTVQAYHDRFRALQSLALKHPVTGAEAVYCFERGLSDRVRAAAPLCGGSDLYTVVRQAKCVNAALSTSRAALAYCPGVGAPADAGVPKPCSASKRRRSRKRQRLQGPGL